MPLHRILVALTLAIASQPALAQTLTASPTSVYANSPVTLTLTGLPPSATGTVLFTDGSTTLANITITGTTAASYQAFGDSITASPSYADLIAANYGLALTNESIATAIACDILPTEILANNLGPSQLSSPLTSLMTGSNDAVINTPSYDPVFTACHQATLAWLATPRESRLLSGDPAITILSGSWSADPTTFNTLINTSGGTVRYTITTAGAPIYLWQLLSDSLPGTFTLTLDAIPSATIYSTQPTPAIASRNTPLTFGLIRLPVLPGTHTVDITAISGTIGILAAATPSSTLHPTVLVTDVPNQLPGNAAAIAQYTQDIHADRTLLATDGLDLRYIPTQPFLLGTPAEMLDPINPNPLGQSHLAAAFATALGSLSTTPFTAFTNTPPTTTATFANPGLHTLTATYSGDSAHAPKTASGTINILPQQPTLTTLATPSTHAYAGSSVAFTVNVSPATATGTITLYDGTQLLAQLPQSPGAVLYLTSTLAVGIHTLTAVYSGDAADISSASPTLAIQIQPTPTTLTLAPIAATATYGASTTLTATISPATASGTITFYDNNQTLAAATLTSGSATVTPTLTIGTHTFTAVYSGDQSNLPTSSLPISTTIQPITTSTSLAPIPASIGYGNPITLTGSVSPAAATGAITFHDSISGTLAQSALINGIVTITTSTLPLGNHTFTAIYSGDTTHTASSSQPISTQVLATSTTTTLTAIPATLTAGSPLTLSAQVTPITATGTILFRDATTGTLGQSPVVNGAATLQLAALPAAQYSITATYSGDATDATSTSPAVTTHITLNPTTITLTQPATALYAALITLTATVTPANATGLVQFADTNGTIASALLINGTASVQLSTLTTGPHTLHATYLGDNLYAPSTSASAITTIAPNPTTTTLTLSQSTTPAGGLVTFDVRVASASNPTGSITILSGTNILASAPLANAGNGAAYATLTLNAAVLGAVTVTASYSGDNNDLASTSTPASFTIIPTPTTAMLSVSAISVPPQSTVTITASVASTTQTPTGSILFAANGKTLATIPLNPSGQASTTLVSPAIGTWAITATYIPTGLFAATSAPPQTLTVTLPVAVTLAPSTMNATPGSASTATLTITPLSGFSGPIQAQCQSPEPYIACTIDAPTSISAPANATVHIVIPTSTAASIFPLLGLLLLPLFFHRKRQRSFLIASLCMALISTSGCGEGGDFFNIPNGKSAITLNVTAAGTIVTTTLTVNISQ